MLDFNLVPRVCDYGLTDGVRGCGTNSYRAPEIFDQSLAKLDFTLCDAWAAGLVLYYMLEKKLPFTAE